MAFILAHLADNSSTLLAIHNRAWDRNLYKFSLVKAEQQKSICLLRKMVETKSRNKK